MSNTNKPGGVIIVDGIRTLTMDNERIDAAEMHATTYGFRETIQWQSFVIPSQYVFVSVLHVKIFDESPRLWSKTLITSCDVLSPLYMKKDRFQYYCILKILLL